MKRYLYFSAFFVGTFLMASAVSAQLPANPWTPQPPTPNDGDFGANASEPLDYNSPDAPAYVNNSITNGEVLPVDPWARARDRSGVRTWRGSGKHGELNYIGEATTWGTAMGQEMIAPEVNRHNMLVMTDHLRNMGYKIPKSYDQKIKDMPKAYRSMLQDSMNNIPSATDPLSQSFYRIMTDVEAGTGLDFDNLLFNSLDILGTD
ncbi:MAG: hypothetical protein PHE89_06530 [Alphaproteobacteria bacterium]|nr:hypothetical protein [Alphaproteobacteria bacterium]